MAGVKIPNAAMSSFDRDKAFYIRLILGFNEVDSLQTILIWHLWTYVSSGLWAYSWNLADIHFALNFILMIKSGHNFAHVTTAQLSWHVQNYDLNL